jgi:hypothetical protein
MTNNGKKQIQNFETKQLELFPNNNKETISTLDGINHPESPKDINSEMLKLISDMREEISQLKLQTRPIHEKIITSGRENIDKLANWGGGKLKSAWAGFSYYKDTVLSKIDAIDSKNIAYNDPALKEFLSQEKKLLESREDYKLDLEDINQEISELRLEIAQTKELLAQLHSGDIDNELIQQKDYSKLHNLQLLSQQIIDLKDENRFDEAMKLEFDLNDKKSTVLNAIAKKNYKILNKLTATLLETEAEKLNLETQGIQYLDNDYLDRKLTYLRGLEAKLALKDINYLASEEYTNSPLKKLLDRFTNYKITSRPNEQVKVVEVEKLQASVVDQDISIKPNSFISGELSEVEGDPDVNLGIYKALFGIDSDNGFKLSDYDKVAGSENKHSDIQSLKPGQKLDLSNNKNLISLDLGDHKLDISNQNGLFDDKINTKYGLKYSVKQTDRKLELAEVLIKGSNGNPDIKLTLDRNNKIIQLKVDKKLWSRDSQSINVITNDN